MLIRAKNQEPGAKTSTKRTGRIPILESRKKQITPREVGNLKTDSLRAAGRPIPLSQRQVRLSGPTTESPFTIMPPWLVRFAVTYPKHCLEKHQAQRRGFAYFLPAEKVGENQFNKL